MRIKMILCFRKGGPMPAMPPWQRCRNHLHPLSRNSATFYYILSNPNSLPSNDRNTGFDNWCCCWVHVRVASNISDPAWLIASAEEALRCYSTTKASIKSRFQQRIFMDRQPTLISLFTICVIMLWTTREKNSLLLMEPCNIDLFRGRINVDWVSDDRGS